MENPDLMATAFRMIGSLILVLGLIAVGVHTVKRLSGRSLFGAGSRRIQIIDSSPLGLKKQLSLVRVGDAVLVLGITRDRIVCLDKIDRPESVAALNTSPSATPSSSFSDQLSRRRGPDSPQAPGKAVRRAPGPVSDTHERETIQAAVPSDATLEGVLPVAVPAAALPGVRGR